jgi:hypothetical protein
MPQALREVSTTFAVNILLTITKKPAGIAEPLLVPRVRQAVDRDVRSRSTLLQNLYSGDLEHREFDSPASGDGRLPEGSVLSLHRRDHRTPLPPVAQSPPRWQSLKGCTAFWEILGDHTTRQLPGPRCAGRGRVPGTTSGQAFLTISAKVRLRRAGRERSHAASFKTEGHD